MALLDMYFLQGVKLQLSVGSANGLYLLFLGGTEGGEEGSGPGWVVSTLGKKGNTHFSCLLLSKSRKMDTGHKGVIATCHQPERSQVPFVGEGVAGPSEVGRRPGKRCPW